MPTNPYSQTTEPFQFHTRVHLQELTGLKAKNLAELLILVRSVPDAVIYHHTHHFLQQHHYLSPEPPNDFAYWVTAALNEVKLGEKLASINTCEYSTLQSLREKIVTMITEHLKKSKEPLKEASEGQEFYFIKSVSFILPTPYTASTLQEFIAVLKKVSIHSIYFHMFEARLRLQRPTNDFSLWLEVQLGEKDLAKKIMRLDPYTQTLESLRNKIIQLGEARLKEVMV